MKTPIYPFMNLLPENDLAHTVIGLAIEIHKSLGPGLTEEAYLQCLLYELDKNGIDAVAQKSMPIQYKELHLDHGYTIDLLVDDKLVVELETCEQISEQMVQRTLRNLKLGQFRLGLIINFNAPLLKKGIRRITNHKFSQEEEAYHEEYSDH